MPKTNKKKWVCAFRLLCIFVLIFNFSAEVCGRFAKQKNLSSPHPRAAAAALADVTSGRLLFSKQGDKQLKIASLTKIMTAIVALEQGKLTGKVRMSPKATRQIGSSLYLRVGEEISLMDLLYGMMLRSGNDAAMAVAEHIGGSEQGFVFLMNRKAEELGLSDTHFENPHGLDAAGHYSSANDLVKLAVYCLKNENFRKIVKTKRIMVKSLSTDRTYRWINKNKMLHFYSGADGIKTGFTTQALRTLVSSATKNQQQLVAVTLKDRQDWDDHQAMLNYGFSRFPLKTLVKKEETMPNFSYKANSEFRYPLAEGEAEQIERHFIPYEEGSFAYQRGYVGVLRLIFKEKRIGTVLFVKNTDNNTALNENLTQSKYETQSFFGTSFRKVMHALLLGEESSLSW